MIEGTDCVAAAAHAGDDGIRKSAFLLQNIRLNFLGDDGLEVTDYGREGVGTHTGAEAVVRVLDAHGPCAHGLRDRVL